MDFVANYSCYDGSGLSSNSVTPVYWDTWSTDTRDSTLTTAVITMCIILVGVPSNLLILASILRRGLYRQPTYILLLNLTATNLSICLLSLPFTVIAGFAGSFVFGSTDRQKCRACQFSAFCLFLFGLLAIHLLSLLSLDRFLFIKWSIKYHQLVTCRRTIVACTSCWLLCTLLSLPPLFGFGDILFDLRVAVCSVHPNGENKVTKNIYYFFLVALEMCIPLGLLVLTNFWIVCIIQKQMRKIYSRRRKHEDTKESFSLKIKARIKSSKSQKQIQLFKVFGAIMLANIITWIPFFVRVIGMAVSGDIFSKWFHVLIYITIVSFTFIHPIIEARLIPELRNTLTGFFQKLLCWQHDKNSSTTQCGECSCSERVRHCWPGGYSLKLECLVFLSATIISSEEEESEAV